MPWPPDHPAITDPRLRPWAGGLDEVVPGARVEAVLRYVPGRRVATLVRHGGERAVVKVFGSPRARGNARRLRAFATSPAASLVPAALGCDAAGHVLAVTYREGASLASLPEPRYPDCYARVGAALRRLHDSAAQLDRTWSWEHEVGQLRRHAVPATAALVETLAASTVQLGEAPLSPAHRDCHPQQLVVAADDSVAFVDLDDAALAPRGLDLGNVLGHLVLERLTGARSARTAAAAREALLDGYGPSAELDEAVLTGWALLAVARLAALAETRFGDLAQRDALLAAGLAGLPAPPGMPSADERIDGHRPWW